MRILVASPATRVATQGNQVTAERWAGFLRQLGHQVVLASPPVDDAELDTAELLIALHARKSADVAWRFHQRHPRRPLVVALTGTDLYGDVPDGDAAALRSLAIARRLITLHPEAPEALPAEHRGKAVVVVQSIAAPAERPAPRSDIFEVCLSGHLRPVKDPFRAAQAVRLLPAASRVRITHLGAALDEAMERQARRETASNPRYEWVGAVPRDEAIRRMAQARLVLLTSKMEGGANVICEALAVSVPVISTAIHGSLGLLGEGYPGTFPVGDTEALAELLRRAETDGGFYAELQRRCEERRYLVAPERERRSLAELLLSLAGEFHVD